VPTVKPQIHGQHVPTVKIDMKIPINYPSLFQHVYCEPLALDPMHFQSIHAWLWPRIIGQTMEAEIDIPDVSAAVATPRPAAASFEPHLRPTRAGPIYGGKENGYAVVDGRYFYTPSGRNDTAIIPINGTLNKMAGPLSEACMGMVNTDRLSYAFKQAVTSGADQTVLDLTTPGGQVVGSHEFAQQVREARDSGHRIYAFVDNLACSAGQNIAAQATEVYITPTARLGSIGTIMGFLDHSEAMAKMGIKAETFFAGKHKAVGSPGRPLSKEDREYMQSIIDQANAQLVASVKAGRPRASEEALTSAKTFAGAEAVKHGLADGLVNSWAEFLSLI
jgi:signal peptide peptidase SppA